MKMTITAMLVLALILTSAPTVMAEEDDESKDLLYNGWTEAARRGPILWYVRDEEKRKAMEEDLELLRLHNEAYKAKQRRRTIGAWLFYPGAAIIGLSIAAGVFQHSLGLYDEETGTVVMIGGVAAGAALAAPGIYLRAKISKEDKTYMDYVREKYKIIPVLEKEPDGTSRVALIFNVNF